MSRDRAPKGTAQPERVSPLLVASQPPVDGLPPEARLAFSAQVAELFKYYDAENREDGSFATFFEAAPEVALAQIAVYRPPALPPPLDGEETTRLAASLLPLLVTADRWWRTLPARMPLSFQKVLEHAIRRDLVPALATLMAVEPALVAETRAFDAPVWRGGAPPSVNPSHLAAMERVVREALDRVSKQAKQVLEEGAAAAAAPLPQVALYQVFARLLGYPLELVNAFPGRQLDFYYRQILQQAPRPPTPDRALVAFVPAEDAPSKVFPKGTALSAGRDALGIDRVYALVADTRVDQACVDRVHVLHVRPSSEVSPAREVFFSTFAPAGSALSEAGVPPFAPGFPTFGADPEARVPYAERMIPAEVGFALRSSLFVMEGGERRICLRMRIAREGPKRTGGPLVSRVWFKVRLSGPAGWIDAGDVVAVVTRSRLAFFVRLDASQPAVAPYDASVLGPGFSDGPPVLVALLDQTKTSFLGSGLSHAVVYAVTATVHVKGLRSLSLSNDAGPLLAGRPFAPLGYAPPLGAAFLIGSPEVFTKSLHRLSVHLRWAARPVPALPPPLPPLDWFTIYYDGYELAFQDPTPTPSSSSSSSSALGSSSSSWSSSSSSSSGAPSGSSSSSGSGALSSSSSSSSSSRPAYDNGSFRVAFDYRRDGTWVPFRVPERETMECSLFSRELWVTYAVAEETTWTLEAMSSRSRSSSWSQSSSSSSSSTTGVPLIEPVDDIPLPTDLQTVPDAGVLRMRLVAPAYGFGQSIYPRAAAALALYNAEQLLEKYAPRLEGCPPEPPGPPWPAALNLPYTPMLAEVSLDYVATQELDPCAALSPVGPLGPELQPRPWMSTLLPALNPGGTLFLGFHGVEAENPVACLFVLQDQARTARPSGGPGSIRWSYRGPSVWVDLATTTGDEPSPDGAGMVCDQTNRLEQSGLVQIVVPEDGIPQADAGHLAWVRARVDHPGAYAATHDLMTQAAWCERLLDPLGDPTYDAPLPPGSITALVDNEPAIAEVIQPLPSGGGRRGEDTAALYARVSERCRHKARALSPWDYERLVLGQFPWVFAARCVRRDLSAPLSAPPLRVLVCPRVYDPSALTAPTYPPHVLPAHLEEIRAFLAGRAPAAAGVRVEDPVYRQVVVSCVVRVAARQDPLRVERRLQDGLRALFSAWIFRPEQAGNLSGPANVSEILRFVRTSDGVSAILSLSVAYEDGEEWLGPSPSPSAVEVSAFQHDVRAMSSR